MILNQSSQDAQRHELSRNDTELLILKIMKSDIRNRKVGGNTGLSGCLVLGIRSGYLVIFLGVLGLGAYKCVW